MPGMTTHLNLLADRPGEFPGISANFSGDGFADMRFIVKAVPAADFDSWVVQARGSGSASTFPAMPHWRSRAKPCRRRPFAAVDPKLFERIVDQTALGPEKAGTSGAWYPPAQQAGG